MKKTKRKAILFIAIAIIAVIVGTYIFICAKNNEPNDIATDIATLSDGTEALAGVTLNTSGYNHNLNGWLGNFVVGGSYKDGYCMYLGNGAPSSVTNRGSAYDWFKDNTSLKYNRLKWLFDNMVVVFQPINDKVYGNDLSNEITMYKKNINLLISKYKLSGNIDSLTEKQIFEVQQCVLWNFINGVDYSKKLSGSQKSMYTALIKGMNDNETYSSKGTDIVTVSKGSGFKLSDDGKIGPFKLNNSKGKINRILVENFSGIDGGYTIVDSSGKKIDEYNKYNGDFYIKLNKKLSKGTKYTIKGSVSTKSYKTIVTEWWDGNNGHQPVTTFERDPEKSSVSFNSDYFSGSIDLALKKQITQVNGDNVGSDVRCFNVDASKLVNNTSTNATYNMRKTPVNVEVGDKVKYKIRILNESKELDGYAKEITDYIPDGMKFDVSSNINTKYNWRLYKSNGNEVKWSQDTTLEFFANIYKDVLKRSQTVEQLKKDSGVMGHWANYASGKNTIETEIANIINSTEGKQKTNSLSDKNFVILMYKVIHNSTPSDSIVSNHVKTLNGDKNKRPELVQRLLNDQRFRSIKYSKMSDSDLAQVKYITTDYLSNEKITKLTDASSLAKNCKEVEVELTVNNDATGILTNIAEITNYGYMSGSKYIQANKSGVDIDSVQDNVTVPSNKTGLENYWGKDKGKKNEPANYPGQQDDDDFEKVKVDNTLDLALKKAIIKVDNTKYNRLGTVNPKDLKSGKDTTADYHMDKELIEVEQGNKVTYRIYIFNEGNIDATASEITDYLPSELEFLPDELVNKAYKWTATTDKNGITTIKTDYLKNRFIDRYSNKMKEQEADINSAYVDIVCRVKDDATTDVSIVNIAEISEYQTRTGFVATDIDSGTTGSDKVKLPATVDAWRKYSAKGLTIDLDENDYPIWYGQQDDDDFDRITVKKTKEFDLALRKFITNVNDQKVANRAPKISRNSWSQLVSEGTAGYYHTKEAIEVNNGDIITYTLRVYNEGELKGKATEITDYLPEGLEFYSSEVDGINYGWSVVNGTNGKEIKTSYLANKEYLPAADSYQTFTTEGYADVKVKCRVNLSNTNETVYLTNRAEITAHVDEFGNTTRVELDRDSTPKNVKSDHSSDMLNYDSSITYDSNTYYPGYEDDDDKETVYVKKRTNFNVNLLKVSKKQLDDNTPTPLNGAKFTLAEVNPDNMDEVLNNLAPITTGNSQMQIISRDNCKIGSTYLYKLQETDAPNGFNILIDIPIYIQITINEDGSFDTARTRILYNAENGNDVSEFYRFAIDGNNINIRIANEEKEFDLALRKYITGIERQGISNEINSRIPNLNVFSLMAWRQKGTAGYYHTKEAMSVKKDDIITYTITVYNEGFVKGYATEITDYLPSGLEYINNDFNRNNGWSVTKNGDGTSTVKTNKLSNTLLNENQLDKYLTNQSTTTWKASVQIQCKVVNDPKYEVQYLTNRAEITQEKAVSIDEQGRETVLDVVDRDSKPNNVKSDHSSDMLNYDSSITYDSNTYYPGYEDDDDKETVKIEPITDFEFKLKKIDNVSKQEIEGATFEISGVNTNKGGISPITSIVDSNGNEVRKNQDGSITIPIGGVTVKVKGVDVNTMYNYSIQEVKAPDKYNIIVKNMIVNISVDEDGNTKPNISTMVVNEITNQDGHEVEVPKVHTQVGEGSDENASVRKENNEIIVRVSNKNTDTFDLALRKFITKVNDKEPAVSRVPKLDLLSLIGLNRTGTAYYNHTKDALTVKTGDIVTYTIGVYNESDIKGKVAEITDYLPRGLEFYSSEVDGVNYNWKVTKNSDGTTTLKTNYLKDTLLSENALAQTIVGLKTDRWTAEVKLKCKVTDEAGYTIKYLTNRAEITAHEDERGNKYGEYYGQTQIHNTDRDSLPDTIKHVLNLDNHYIENVLDKERLDYYPGQQDDDDFETLQIEPITDYELSLEKLNLLNDLKLTDKVTFNIEEINPNINIWNGIKNEDIISSKKLDITGQGKIDSKTKVKLGTTYRYRITEEVVPDNFDKTVKEVIIKVNVDEDGIAHGVIEKWNDSTWNSVVGRKYTYITNGDNNKITLTIKNEPKAYYDLKLKKVNEEGKEIGGITKFNVMNPRKIGHSVTTGLGYTGVVDTNIPITSGEGSDTYVISEIEAPDGYIKITDFYLIVSLYKGISQDGSTYVIEKCEKEIKQKNGSKNTEEQRKILEKATVDTDGRTVTVTFPNKKIEGKYYIALAKADENGNTIEDKEATFVINDREQTTSRGTLSIDDDNVPGIKITDKNQNDKYVITETIAPEGYAKFDGRVNLDVKVKEENGEYRLDTNNTKLTVYENGSSYSVGLGDTSKQVSFTIDENMQVIRIRVKNTKITGKYKLQIKKVDSNNTAKPIPGVVFNGLNPKQISIGNKTTGADGIAVLCDNVEITKPDSSGQIYRIREISVPDGYSKIEAHEFRVNVITGLADDGKSYIVKNATVSIAQTNGSSNSAKERAMLEEGVSIDVNKETQTITITVPNEETTDYNLEINKVDANISSEYLSKARFTINGPDGNIQTDKELQRETDDEATGRFAKEVTGVKVNQTYTYTIEETYAQELYENVFKDLLIKLEITINKNGKIDKENTIVKVEPKNHSDISSGDIGKANEMLRDSLVINEDTNTVTLNIKNPQETRDFEFELFKHDLGDKDEEISGAGFKIQKKQRDDDEWTLLHECLETRISSRELIDKQEKVALGKVFYYEIEETKLPNNNYVKKIQKAIVRIAVGEDGEVTGEIITLQLPGNSELIRYDKNIHGEFVELIKQNGNKFELKIANTVYYHMTLRKRADNKDATNIIGCSILNGGTFKVERVYRDSVGRVTTKEIYNGPATWDFAEWDAIPNSINEYYIQELDAPEGFNNDFKNIRVHLTIRTDNNGNVAPVGRDGTNVDFESASGGVLQDKIKTMLYEKCVVQVEGNTVTINMKDSEIIKEPEKYGFQIVKVDKNNMQHRLKDVQFSVRMIAGRAAGWIPYDADPDTPGIQDPVTNENGVININDIELVEGIRTNIFQINEVSGQEGYNILRGVTVQVTIDLENVTEASQITEDRIKVELMGEYASSYPEDYIKNYITADGTIRIIIPNEPTSYEFVLNKKDEKGQLITADRKQNGKLDGTILSVIEQGTNANIVPNTVLKDGTTSRIINCKQNTTYSYIVTETQNKTGYRNIFGGYFLILHVVTDENGVVKDTNPDDPDNPEYTRYGLFKVNPHGTGNEEEIKKAVNLTVKWSDEQDENGNRKRQVILDIENPFEYQVVVNKVDTYGKPLDKAVITATMNGKTYTMNKSSDLQISENKIKDGETQSWIIREQSVQAPYYNVLGTSKYIKVDVAKNNEKLVIKDYAIYDDSTGMVPKDNEIYKYVTIEGPVVKGSSYSINVKLENPMNYKFKLTKVRTDGNNLTGATVTLNNNTVIHDGNSSYEVSKVVSLGNVSSFVITETATAPNHVNVLENKFALIIVRMSEKGEVNIINKSIYDTSNKNNVVLLPSTDETYRYIKTEITRGSDGIQIVDVKLQNPVEYKFELTKVKSDEQKTKLPGAVLTVNNREVISGGQSNYSITEKIHIGEVKSYVIQESSSVSNHVNILDKKFVVVAVRLDENEELKIVSKIAYDISGRVPVQASSDIWNYVDVYFEDVDGIKVLKVDVVNPVEYKFKLLKTKSDKYSTPLEGATLTVNEETVINNGASSYETTKSINVGEKQTFVVKENDTKPGYINVLKDKYLSFDVVLTEDEKIEIQNKMIFDTSGKVPVIVSKEDLVYNYVDVYITQDSRGVQTINIKVINPLETKFRLVKVTSNGETELNGAKITLNGEEVIKDGSSLYELNKTMNITETVAYSISELGTPKGHVNILENIQLIIVTRMFEDETLRVVSKVLVDKTNGKVLDSSRPEYGYITTNISTEDNIQTLQVNIKNPEEYNLKLYKVDKDTNERMNDIFFDIKVLDEQGNEVALKDSKTLEAKDLTSLKTMNIDGEDGVIKINNILIERPGTFNFVLKEYSPELYLENGEIKVQVTIVEEDGSYKVSSMKVIEGEDSIQASDTKVIVEEPETVQIAVDNERIKGKYDLIINKLDNYTKKLLDGSKFKVTIERDGKESEVYKSNDDVNSKDIVIPTEVEVKDGSLTISNIRIEKPENYIIKLKETKAPDTYLPLEEEIKLQITTDISGQGKQAKYVLKDVKMLEGNNNGLVSKSNTENKIQIDIQNEQFDLALRKNITQVIANEGKQDERITKYDHRLPDPKTDGLKDKTQTTAIYNHTKEPVRVYAGNTVIYTLRVYNEGQVDGYAEEVTDHLPEYLEFVNDEFNGKYGWLLDEKDTSLRTVKTNYLSKARNEKGNLIKAFDKETGKLDYKEIQIKCRVKTNVPVKAKLTNIAEITKYIGKDGREVTDRDSFNKVKLPTDDKLPSYKDDEINKSYVPGQEDDDDFEKVLVEKFDLALRKYITKVDDKDITDRVPVFKIDENGNYVYNHTKEPVLVGDSDVVTYNIRVYNEGTVAGYAEEVEDDIPEGLVFLPDNETNKTYKWVMLDENKQETSNPDDAKYIRTKYLSSENKDNLLKAFDKEQMNEPDSRYVQVAFKVVVPDATDEIIINKAQITDDKDEDGKDVDDDDSTPDEWNEGEDDQDIEKIKLTYFDLALRKFITKVNDTDITNRVPVFKVDENGKYVYEHTKEPVVVNNTNVVTYTLRVYNEGTRAGYAKEIKDDIPQGLKFLPNNETNKEYRWIMLDEKGNETENVNEAKYITSDYLSKENEKVDGENILKPFDKDAYKEGSIKEPDYKEVKVAFEVTEPNTSDRIIINSAQISDDSDEDGNEVTDKDSTPNEWNEGEDDQDIEKIKVQYFDLALRKWVTKAIVIEDGKETVTNTGHKAEDDPEAVVKVDLKKSKLNKVVVKFEYQIRVTNEGQIAGSVEEISDYIPEGLKFVAADNPEWEEVDGKVVTDQLAGQIMQPGESKEVTILLTWINREDNMGLKVNVAEISKDYNEYGTPDIDSTPNNKVPGEDDIDDAPVMLTVTTGQEILYIGITIMVLAIIAGGTYGIKRFAVDKNK